MFKKNANGEVYDVAPEFDGTVTEEFETEEKSNGIVKGVVGAGIGAVLLGGAYKAFTWWNDRRTAKAFEGKPIEDLRQESEAAFVEDDDTEETTEV